MAKTRRLWQHNETKLFFKSWKDNAFLNRFLKRHSNKDTLHWAIRKDLQKAGYIRSLTEIHFKMKNYRRSNLLSKEKKLSNYRWYNEVKEIFQLEKIEHELRQAASSKKKQESKLCEKNVEGDISKSDESVQPGVHKDENNFDSDYLSPSAIKHGEPEVSNNIQTILPESSGNNSKKSVETILLDICKEFQNSNRELEVNDIRILELLKETNDTFRKQTKLLMKFL